MKFPFSWLKEYVDVQGASAQIAKILTQAGIEVDAVVPSALSFQKVIVGKVLAVAKHPNADKLQIATVFDGSQEHQVVCGASNCRAGLKTAFAVVGATLQDESGKSFSIKKAKVRDVESFGMLCSADELCLGGESDGIIEFADHVLEGTDVAEMYADHVFEVSLTPNLGHCLNIVGIARELAAATGESLKYPEVTLREGNNAIEQSARVSVLDADGCPRYACRVIKGVKVSSSPEWLQKKLQNCGLRPVNNIVDATNYVLMELGHPLHAFDLNKFPNHSVVIRKAKEGESLVTLDGKERLLTQEDVVISGQNDVVAVAGVMGGQNTEVDESTTDILIESAYFKPSSIRKTSKRLALQTDASKRFERSADPNLVPIALDRVTALIQQLAGGEICKGVIDIYAKAFPPLKLECRYNRINSLLGTHLSVSEIEQIFHRLGFGVHWDGQHSFLVTVPTYRADITQEVDLIEEVARIFGYENIPSPSPRYHGSTLPHAPLFSFERKARKTMLAEGLQEFLTCDLIGPSLLGIVQNGESSIGETIQVLNPTSIEQSILRTSLLPGLLQVVKFNIDHQNRDIHGFEIGRIHFKQNDQYKEQSVLGIVLTGQAFPHRWDESPRDVDFYDLKGLIENFLSELKIQGVQFKSNPLSTFHSGRQTAVYVGSEEIGAFGEIHPAIQRRLDVSQRIYFAEFNLNSLLQLCPAEPKIKALPLYPASERDWTVTLKDETPIAQVFQILHETQSRLLEDISLVVIYRSEKLGAGLKNATFHFVYRDTKKTIAQETVDAEHARILDQVTKRISNL